jgi:ACS family tartrate transporter-like MFS transporter
MTDLDISQQTRRHIARRLLPFLFLLYVINYIDRVNLAYAALTMKDALGFSDRVFGLGAGIFYIGYFVLQIPGALIVERWSARKWIGPLMVTWGMVTLLTAFIQSGGQFYTARFLLGTAEAGFAPGMYVYLSHWFCQEDRGKAIAAFMCAVPVSSVMGAPIAGSLLSVHWLGIDGWRWLFVLEGIPAMLLGIATVFYLTDRPSQARWLTTAERSWISGELEREQQAKHAQRSWTVWQALRQHNVVLLTLICFFFVAAETSLMLWLPTILKRLSASGGAVALSNVSVASLTAIPYAVALAAMLLNGWHSDKTGERRWHTAAPLFGAGAAFLLVIALGSRIFLAVVLFTLVVAFLNAFKPSFWTFPTITLGQSAAAASIGFINSVGNLGSFLGPFAVGYLATATHSFSSGLIFMMASVCVSGALVMLLRVPRRMEFAG